VHFPLQLSSSIRTNRSKEDDITKRKPLIYSLVFVAAAALRAALRPERLFVKAKANEAMPSSLANASETVLASGSFHSDAHDSEGMVSI